MPLNPQTSAALKKAFIEAYRKHWGVISHASREVGIDRSTFANWKKSDPEFKAAIEDVEFEQIDNAEAALFDLIKQRDVASTIFYLKTKGRHRGYTEKIGLENESPVKLQINITKESDE